MSHRRPPIERAILCLALLLAPSVRAADNEPPDLQSRLDTLVSQLASDSWKQRKDAMEKLVAVGEDALPRLHRLAEQSDDGEVRARATAAVARIEENRKTGMTLVTLNLDDVPAQQAVAELARQARAPLPTDPPNLLTAKSTKRVSLHADHRPFWEVMQDLCRQADLEVTSITRHNRDVGLGLARGDADWMDKPIVLGGPLLIRADHLMRVSTIRLKPPRNTVEEFSIALTVFAEPKLKVLDYSAVLRLEEAVDDQGNSLIPPEENGGVAANVDSFGNGREGTTSRWDVGATLHYPKGAGSKIARLRAAVALQVQTRAATLELPLANARNVSRNLEGLAVVIKNADAGKCEISVNRDGRNDADWYAVRMQLFAGEARLLDDKGNVVAHSHNTPDSDDSPDGQRMDLRIRFTREGGDDGKEREGKRKGVSSEASTLIWEFPVESRQLSVPFEFHDLPMPR
jgi:hypothetical protein